MLVKLTQNTTVRFDKGTVLDVSEKEASRLLAFNLAVVAPEPKPKKTKAK